MDSMVERVARAICRHEGDEEDWPCWFGEARAAIEAMREPTEAMVDAFVWYGHGKTIGDVARIGWQSMIDAALSPEIEG